MKLLFTISFSFLLLITQAQTVPEGSVEDYIKSSLAFRRKKEFNQAISLMEKALELSKKEKDTASIFRSTLLLASFHSDANQFDEALKMLWNSEKYVQGIDDGHFEYNNQLGKLFEKMNLPNEAIIYRRKTYKSAPDFWQAGVIANLYAKLDKHDSALYYYQLQIDKAFETQDPGLKASGHNNKGLGFFRNNQNDSALSYYFKATEYLLQIPDLSEGGQFLYGTIQGNIGQGSA